MNIQQASRYTSNNTFSDLCIQWVRNFSKQIAFHLNVREALICLPYPNETSDEYYKRTLESQKLALYYSDSARAIWRGVSIETLRVLEKYEGDVAVWHAMTDSHNGNLAQIGSTNYFLNWRDTGEKFISE